MDKNKIGMVLFICSEAIFFGLLVLAYGYFRNASTTGPSATDTLDPKATGLVSLFLFSSSFTVWQAGKSLKAKQHGRLSAWLLATIVLGALFLAGQGQEWKHLIDQGATVSRNLFGTTFFTLTGFHGLHVLIGLVALTILLGLTLAGDFRGPDSAAIETVSLYWHFVDGVWVVIFGVVYLSIAFG
jgi:heme/copper-type cytochrome/quinol oxidase subunit 3